MAVAAAGWWWQSIRPSKREEERRERKEIKKKEKMMIPMFERGDGRVPFLGHRATPADAWIETLFHNLGAEQKKSSPAKLLNRLLNYILLPKNTQE